jgi:cobalt-zinc-cadmium efflux system membrane fusion protein
VVLSYRQTWLGWFTASSPTSPDDEQTAAPADQVVLSPKARENLGLPKEEERLYTRTYERKVQLPGEIVDWPGYSDRGVVSPVTGTVLKIHGMPGDVVSPGQVLFTLQLNSESLSTTRSELFKARRDHEITLDRRKRLADPATGVEAVAGSRIVDLDNQLRRLDAAISAYRQELHTRGLKKEQIDAAEKGPPFEDKMDIVAPPQVAQPSRPAATGTESVSFIAGKDQSPAFEVQDLKAELGQQVQAGQTLCTLADHHWLYIEGHGFRQEIPLVARAAKEGWKVQVEFLEESNDGWEKPLETAFQIRHLANNLDPATRTFAFYLPLHNQSDSYEKDRRKLLRWRFRPGQRVRLNVPVKEFEEQLDKDGKPLLKEKRVFVVPSEAVVRDGPEAYVFEQKGEAYRRHSVRVLYEDRQEMVIDKDSLPLGLRIARRGALQINRVLKSQGSKLPPGYHMHADGSVHMNQPGDE